MSNAATTQQMIEMLKQAVYGSDCSHSCCSRVKEALETIVRSDHEFLEPRYLSTAPDRYARRLLHRDPDGKFSVLVMVWDKDQGTALHDHSGMWCVECVYKGRIEVVSYDVLNSPDDPLVHFQREQTVMAGIGEAGTLIPPFDYHTIKNIDDTPAITIHVYGGEMTWCHAYVPVEGGYRKERRELEYTP